MLRLQIVAARGAILKVKRPHSHEGEMCVVSVMAATAVLRNKFPTVLLFGVIR